MIHFFFENESLEDVLKKESSEKREEVNVSDDVLSVFPRVSGILNGQFDDSESTEDFNSKRKSVSEVLDEGTTP